LDTWHGKDGDKRSKLRVAAERVQFLDRKMAPEREQEEASAST
jgi:single-strand DNA-binding protein